MCVGGGRGGGLLSFQLEWLSRDNLSNPPFALVTYITSCCKIRSEIHYLCVCVWGGGGGEC